MEKNIIQALDRGLQVLDLFRSDKKEWGITEISDALNLYKSSVYNILTTLEKHEFVTQDTKSKKYKLGVKLFELGSIFIQDIELKDIAHDYIDMLAKEFDETVHLAMPLKGEVFSVEYAE